MIHVIASITAVEGQRDALLEHFRALVPTVLEERGCIEYGAAIDMQTGLSNQSAPRTNVVTVVEKWEDLDALKAHLAAPHMVEFRERVKGLVAAIDLTILQPA